MALLLYFLSLCFAASTSLVPHASARSSEAEVVRNKRIVHGQPEDPTPNWFAAIAQPDNVQRYTVLCGAVVLPGLSAVLAAAHCFDRHKDPQQYRELTVLAGFQHGGPQQQRKVQRLHVHEHYTTRNDFVRVNDIAVVGLAANFDDSRGVVGNAEVATTTRRPYATNRCRLLGLGRTETGSPTRPLKAAMKSIAISISTTTDAHQTCGRRLADMKNHSGLEEYFPANPRAMVEDNKFCAEMRENPEPILTEGDRGAPLDCFTHGIIDGLHVQSYDSPGMRTIHIFTFLSRYRAWITNAVQLVSPRGPGAQQAGHSGAPPAGNSGAPPPTHLGGPPPAHLGAPSAVQSGGPGSQQAGHSGAPPPAHLGAPPPTPFGVPPPAYLGVPPRPARLWVPPVLPSGAPPAGHAGAPANVQQGSVQPHQAPPAKRPCLSTHPGGQVAGPSWGGLGSGQFPAFSPAEAKQGASAVSTDEIIVGPGSPKRKTEPSRASQGLSGLSAYFKGLADSQKPNKPHAKSSSATSGNVITPAYSGKGKETVPGQPTFRSSQGYSYHFGIPQQQHSQGQLTHSAVSLPRGQSRLWVPPVLQSGAPPAGHAGASANVQQGNVQQQHSQGQLTHRAVSSSRGQSARQRSPSHHYGGQRSPSPTTQRPH